ncbi:hypothetical protein B0J13DRAFT_581543 [Dactylonectria estremocensis]|uniref:Enoyl reductase (ER) domain-containing protein n=1 Tax=Dactylonectria estremocensis TaxID=1079267 RepID=A0A9P9F9S6_9HYPO|nr:hypothetical protein B0J13DRAFT_581543 [Dactylonectria estremocensis]
MRAWQCAAPGPMEKTLKLIADAPRPSQEALQKGELLVAVARAGLNPADYKMLGLGVASRALAQFPKTPGMDFSGRVVAVAEDVHDLRPGDAVLGRVLAGRKGGTLGEVVVVRRDACAAMLEGVDWDEAAGMPTAGLTAYLTIAPHVAVAVAEAEAGAEPRVFINGGSGGVGLFGIQVAKALGCRVTASCSTGKASLCRSVGADDIIDYKTTDVVAALKQEGQVYSLAVDNVGCAPADLHAASHHFLRPGGPFVFVGGAVTCGSARSLARSVLLPAWLGGGKRRFVGFNVYNDQKALETVVGWMAEGKVRTVVDSVFEFADVAKAYEKLRKGSSGGKIIVRVGDGKL